ncbi:MAG: hypothetical protein JXR83_04350 [Deltaproteobacteria bacterium]|nr:hypothetical protein [Deltaproteobacteria bacterium]
MRASDLAQFELDAAAAMTERHRASLRPGEMVAVRLTFYRGVRRVALSLDDADSGQKLELFADVPDVTDTDAIELGLDFLDGVLAEILAGGREAHPPLDAAPYPFEGKTVYLSGGLRRPDLETAADDILGQGKRR